MSTEIECPICMDCIESNKNCVTTECGHCFHTNCLMKSVAHNGFGCPYCRTAMAEAPEDSDDGYEEEYDEEEEEEDMFNDYALLGFRLFQNNIMGEVHDPEDIEEEAEFEAPDEEEDNEDNNDPKPSADIITMKLIQQGVNMEQLVKCLLVGCHNEYSEDEDYNRVDDEVFGKMRIIISNFTPEQTIIPQPVLSRQRSVNSEAQGKKIYTQNIESCIDIFVM